MWRPVYRPVVPDDPVPLDPDPDPIPDDPDPMEPELEPGGELSRSIWLPALPLLLLLPLGSWPGNCAVWQAGRGSLGRQSAGAWPDSPVLPGDPGDMEPEDEEPGLVVLPLPCTVESERSLGDVLWAMAGEASKTATAAAVRRRFMRLSFPGEAVWAPFRRTGMPPWGSRRSRTMALRTSSVEGPKGQSPRRGRGLTNVKAMSWPRRIS